MTDAKPFPKSAQLARGERRYRRKIASPKQWQAIQAAKGAVCRLSNPGVCESGVEYHHLVPRGAPWFGDDVADNIVPLCRIHHGLITNRVPPALRRLGDSLTEGERAYMIERGGEDYPERAYGIRYAR